MLVARGCEVPIAAVVCGAGVEAPGEAVGGACVVPWKAAYTLALTCGSVAEMLSWRHCGFPKERMASRCAAGRMLWPQDLITRELHSCESCTHPL